MRRPKGKYCNGLSYSQSFHSCKLSTKEFHLSRVRVSRRHLSPQAASSSRSTALASPCLSQYICFWSTAKPLHLPRPTKQQPLQHHTRTALAKPAPSFSYCLGCRVGDLGEGVRLLRFDCFVSEWDKSFLRSQLCTELANLVTITRALNATSPLFKKWRLCWISLKFSEVAVIKGLYNNFCS